MFKSLFLCLIAHLIMLTIAHADSPYAVQSVGTTSVGSEIGDYDYDTSGNRVNKTIAGDTTNNQTTEYGLIGKVSSISQNGLKSSIKHGPDGRRYLRVDSHADDNANNK